ncbi:helix-turn-helix transcriptional regulator [Priestia megaterium]
METSEIVTRYSHYEIISDLNEFPELNKKVAAAFIERNKLDYALEDVTIAMLHDFKEEIEGFCIKANENNVSSSSTTGGPILSERELEILKCVASGKTSNEIAHSLQLTVSSVRYRLSNIKMKLNTNSNLESLEVAYILGLFNS